MGYSQAFYNNLSKKAARSSEVLVPIVYEKLSPASVLDVGCGRGTWLTEWSKYSPDVFGVDGKWVKEDTLEIPQERFKQIDLEKPFDLSRTFDLVTCLEVAEHVTEQAKDNLIDSITKHSDTVLFSAAIPEQGGDNHYNEQWQSYWVNEFKKRGYEFLDPFRHIIWDNDAVQYYYRQNMILFAKSDIINTNEFLSKEKELAKRSLIDVIHPIAIDEKTRSLSKVLPVFLKTLKNAVRNRLPF